jgi:hypothetical protein
VKKLVPKRKTENSDQNSRARAQGEEKLADLLKREPAVRKVIRKAAQLADLITDEDRAENMRVLREAKNATHRVYDKALDSLVEQPDHKTRLAAATLQLAYDEGLPVQRQVALTRNFESASEIIANVKESPELAKAILTLQSQGIQVEADGQVIDIETDVQKTGSESEGDSSEKSEASIPRSRIDSLLKESRCPI